MSNTLFLKEYIIYKPDINKIDEEIVDKLITCKDNYFQSFNFSCICDVKFKDTKNEERIKKEIKDDGKTKKRIETMSAQKKNLRFIEIDKLVIKCWSDFSNNNISYYMSLKIPFINRKFFQKIAHNRQYLNNVFIDLKNEFFLFCCRWYQSNNLEKPLPFVGYICDLVSFFKFVDFFLHVCSLYEFVISNDFLKIVLCINSHKLHKIFYILYHLDNKKLLDFQNPFL